MVNCPVRNKRFDQIGSMILTIRPSLKDDNNFYRKVGKIEREIWNNATSSPISSKLQHYDDDQTFNARLIAVLDICVYDVFRKINL